MEKRKIGNSGIEVSAIGLGTMGMDHAYGPQADRQEMKQLLHRAVELGCNFFDTAVVYGEANEELLGAAFAGTTKRLRKEDGLFFCGIDAVFIGF